MPRHFRTFTAAGALAILPTLAPALAMAQHSMAAQHELGVDVAFAYSKPSGGGNSAFTILTPVDVRVGFVSSGPLMFEPRVAVSLVSTSGASTHDVNLDLNVLYAKNHRKGMYLTAGAGADLVGRTGGTSGSIISLNGGIGTRSPWESAAWRLEAFVRYDLKNTSLGVPNILSIGARVGLSLWH